MTPHELGIRTAFLGMGVNLLLALAKITTGVVGSSYALIADGIESMADVVGSLVVIGGLHVASRPADEDHPFGHGKAEPLAGVGVATLLLLAAGWIVWQSIHEIRSPHHAPAWYTLAVLAAVVVVKETLSRRVFRVAEHLDSSAVRGDAWHHRSDAFTSAAAFLGIGVALMGGPGYESADDWGALAACGVMVYSGLRLLAEATNHLMDRAVPPAQLNEIRQLASEVPGVVAIEKCRARKSGLGLSMDIHITVDGDTTVRRGHEIAHGVKDRLLASGQRITDVSMHVEARRSSGRAQDSAARRVTGRM